MKFKSRAKSPVDPTESGALSDLGFLLIIYFIIIAGFNINQGFLLSLPQKNSTKIVNTEDIIKMNLTEEGSLFFENKKVSISDMQNIIKDKISVRTNMILFLKIAPGTSYQNVVNIVNMAKELKIDNFSFIMDREGK